MNFYPEHLHYIAQMCEALNQAEKGTPEGSPYMEVITLVDGDGTDWGRLVDEIGGAWSWKPPEAKQ